METRDYRTIDTKAIALGLGGAFLTHRSFADGVATVQMHEADMHHWWSDDVASSDRILSERDNSCDDSPALASLRELKASGR